MNPGWEFEGVVRLTRVGTSFVIFTIVIGFAAINTGNNSLYIGLSCMLGALLLSGIASQRGLRALAVDFESIGDAWAGQPAVGRIRVFNRSRIWNVRDVIVTSSELAQPFFIPVIERRTAAIAHVSFVFARRGVVQLKSLDLYTRYPFGLFLKKRRVRISGEVIVFPRLLADSEARERFRAVDGELHPVNRAGSGTDVYSFREYVRGDSLRQVYWRKSASQGRWIVKQTELETGRAVQIVVDPFKPHGASDDDFEKMVSEAATFLYDALDGDVEVILSMPRITVQANSIAEAHPMFRALAVVEPVHEPVAQTIDRNAIVFAVRESNAA